MFGIDSGELLVIALVALVVIGPKDLPRVMRVVGHWVGQARGMARHFRAGIDTMIRESELADMEKSWKAENERIMREHPMAEPAPDWGAPVPALDADDPAIDAPPPPPKPAARPRARPATPSGRTSPRPPPRRSGATLPASAPPAPASGDGAE